MKKNDISARIAAALKKLGPSSPRRILDALGGEEKKLGYYLRRMLAAKQLKAAGTTSNRVYALPGSPNIKSARPAPVPRTTHGTLVTLAEPLVARTADGRIVLIHAGGPGIPTVLDAEFAAPLAELLKAA